MAAIAEADRNDRLVQPVNGERLREADLERKSKTVALLNAGALRSGLDFRRAALILQHGGSPDDFLAAHILALASMSKGDDEAKWLTAATLDRYLQSVGKPQIFGTQYQIAQNAPASQEPYDRTLLPDSLRRMFGVAGAAEQEDKRAALTRQMATAGRPSK